MLEEYEHRDVAFRVYQALFGRRHPVYAYLYRLYGFFYAALHLGKWGKRVTAYLIEKDREGMNAQQLLDSRKRERAFKRTMRKYYLPQLLRVLRPSYDPRYAWPEPRGIAEFVQRIESQYAVRPAEAVE